MRKVLVAGASGMIGSAIAEKFAADPEWSVVALSRRSCIRGLNVEWVHADLSDLESVKALRAIPDVTDIVYSALHATGDPKTNWSDERQNRINIEMYDNLISTVAGSGRSLEHVVLIQGGKAYGLQFGNIPNPARESDPRHMPPNFYFDQEDRTYELCRDAETTWTIFRPMTIIGFAKGSTMNIVGCLAAYGAICKELKLPFRYPGGFPDLPMQMTDANLLASAVLWSMTAREARNEVFNIDNGDVLEWRNAWPAIASFFGLRQGIAQPMPLEVVMRDKAGVWGRIASANHLVDGSFSDIAGRSFGFADGIFNYFGTLNMAFLSSVKLRRAGFHDYVDSRDSLLWWLARLRERRLIP